METRLTLRQIGILKDVTAGVTHCMGILTADKRLFRMLLEKLLNCPHRSIHLALHIAGLIETTLMYHTLIMHQTGIIILTEMLRHIKDILTTAGLITTGPD